MAEIADGLLKYDLDITALQETRWKVYGRIRKPRYTLLYSGAEKQGEQGVRLIIKRSLENSIIDFEPIKLWDTAGLLNDSRSKAHMMLFI